MAKERRVGVSVQRTAEEVKRYRTWKRFVPRGIVIAVLLLVIGYVASVLYTKFGAFTVMVNRFDHNDYALTLSESPQFESHTARLNAEISESVTNIDGNSIPDWVDNVDGEHNGDNYVAYTFYCGNAGSKTVTYNYDMYIANMSRDVEKAVRVRLYIDGKYTDYAYARTDGVKGPEPGTTSFQGNSIVRGSVKHFKPGDRTKFTVVIWLEGNDPDCVDKIIGGKFKIDMAIDVLTPEDNKKT